MKMQIKRPDDTIPTSSMADIAFLLIIYFMVTTTFAATRGLDFSLPQEDDTQPLVEKEESVLIEIQPGGALLVDGKAMELEEVLDYLKPKLERNPMKPDHPARPDGRVRRHGGRLRRAAPGARQDRPRGQERLDPDPARDRDVLVLTNREVDDG